MERFEGPVGSAPSMFLIAEIERTLDPLERFVRLTVEGVAFRDAVGDVKRESGPEIERFVVRGKG
ncbi:MAG: hypothetical protein R3A46_18280 [Thermomicrobiales bacterium]